MFYRISRTPDYRRSTIFATIVFAALTALPALATAADTDSDGIDDASDNCTLVANPDQRDVDVDGFGSLCDPDLNNDQIVNFADLAIFEMSFFTTNDDTDLNADGITNFADLAIVRDYFFAPPGPGAPDVDGDGVPLHQDRCEESPPGLPALFDGCTSFELAEDPDRFMVDVNAKLTALLTRVTGDPDIGYLQDNLLTAQIRLRNAVNSIRIGQMCEGASTMFDGLTALTNARTQLTNTITTAEQQLSFDRPFSERDCNLPSPPPLCAEGADHTEMDDAVMSFWLVKTSLSELHAATVFSAELFETACELAAPGAFIDGRIIAIEPDRGRLFLEGGAYIGIADGAEMPADLYPGRLVAVSGTGYGTSLLADSITTIGSGTDLADFLDYETCVRLRFAPFQRFAPINTGPFTLHEPVAYQYEDGKYRIEHGMRLAAIDIPFCGDSFGPFLVRYSLRLTLQFVNRETDATVLWVLATEFDDGDQPLPLPWLIKPNTDATLFVSHQRQSCEVINLRGANRAVGNSYFICSEQEEYASEQLTLRVYNQGAYCNALYDRTEFSLEEVSQTTFAPTFVDFKQTIFVVPDPGTNMTVVGEGFEVYGPNSSSYPAVKRIDEGEQFAVFEHDCVTEPNQLYVEGTCGTESASGLRWPHLEGVRNGKPFSYSCRVPFVVRDLMDNCNPPPDSFYKLPYSGVWSTTQGNNGAFTHNGSQAYAFDFAGADGATIRAARGGEVTFVREDQTGNSYSDPNCSNCMANAVNIRHQDGTNSQYFHFQTNGVFVNQGQTISRGDAVGRVGNTGYSTGPHLHFHARFAGSDTHTIRFRSIDSAHTTPPFACYIPQQGDLTVSDNN